MKRKPTTPRGLSGGRLSEPPHVRVTKRKNLRKGTHIKREIIINCTNWEQIGIDVVLEVAQTQFEIYKNIVGRATVNSAEG